MAATNRGRSTTVGAVALALVATLFSTGPASAATTGTTTRVSVASDGTGGNNASFDPAITPDGKLVAFSSGASDLVVGDTNARDDVFVHNRTTGTTTRVTVATGGVEANGPSFSPAISADGRYVAFASTATNLVTGDTNGKSDVFVRDRKTGTTTRVSVVHGGAQGAGPTGGGGAGSLAPAISADGRYVAFASSEDLDGDDVTYDDIYVHDRQTTNTTRVSVPSPGAATARAVGTSSRPAISADGRYVAFESEAPNLVDGDTNGGTPFNSFVGRDIFMHDLATGATTRVNVASDGAQTDNHSSLPAISADGRYVAFLSRATTLVAGDTNGSEDVFVRDRQTATTTRVSVANDGSQSGSSFDSLERPAITGDGRYVAFTSRASNLVAGDTNGREDVFVRDRQGETTTRVSVANDGSQAIGESGSPALMSDATAVAFDSWAPNLAGGDTNTTTSDVFVRDTDDVPMEPTKPVLLVGDVAVREGDEAGRAAAFTVTLSKPTTATVTASYATASGTATKAAGDFKGKSGTITIAPGTTSVIVKVPVLGDTSDELNETFTLKVSSITKALAGDVVGVGTILDDDPVTITGTGIAAGDATVHEGDSGARDAVFTVSLSKPTGSPVTVSFAAADGQTGSPAVPHAAAPDDFTPSAGTLTFAPGTTSLAVKVAITTDNATEATEQFRLVLTNPSSGTFLAKSEGRGTVVDDD